MRKWGVGVEPIGPALPRSADLGHAVGDLFRRDSDGHAFRSMRPLGGEV
jgi:hypothetical protein